MGTDANQSLPDSANVACDSRLPDLMVGQHGHRGVCHQVCGRLQRFVCPHCFKIITVNSPWSVVPVPPLNEAALPETVNP